MVNKVAEAITALTTPVNKLIDAVSKGIGCLYEPHKIKKNADAEAYKIKAIGQALSDNRDLPIEYIDNNLKISTSDYEDLQKRTMYRFVRMETQRQYNIENIADKAYDLLKDVKTEVKEEVSQDWIARFISSAQDVSDNIIQELWAKILAGEVKRPNSFSLKTLDILKNMSQLDAQLFSKVCSLVVNNSYVPNDIALLQEFGVSYSDILRLDEQGLINSSGIISQEMEFNEYDKLILKSKKYICIANERSAISLQIFKLSTYGIELYSIIKATEDEDFIFKYAKKIKASYKKSSISLHKINDVANNKISYDESDLLKDD